MDPNANLQQQRGIKDAILRIVHECPENGEYTDAQRRKLAELAGELAELVEALDDWIGGGGFLPHAWKGARYATDDTERVRRMRR